MQDLTSNPGVITLPDGYNGHTLILSTEVVQEDAQCVQLHVHGSSFLTRWVYKNEFNNALQSSMMQVKS